VNLIQKAGAVTNTVTTIAVLVFAFTNPAAALIGAAAIVAIKDAVKDKK
jgi:hypothetical protein